MGRSVELSCSEDESSGNQYVEVTIRRYKIEMEILRQVSMAYIDTIGEAKEISSVCGEI